jgi:hypothetical protein
MPSAQGLRRMKCIRHTSKEKDGKVSRLRRLSILLVLVASSKLLVKLLKLCMVIVDSQRGFIMGMKFMK